MRLRCIEAEHRVTSSEAHGPLMGPWAPDSDNGRGRHRLQRGLGVPALALRAFRKPSNPEKRRSYCTLTIKMLYCCHSRAISDPVSSKKAVDFRLIFAVILSNS